MEINPHHQLLSSPSPLLIKTRKLFLELVGMRVGLVPQLPHQSLLVDAVVSCGSVCSVPSSCESLNIWCVAAACLSLLSCVYFPHCGRISLSFLSSGVCPVFHCVLCGKPCGELRAKALGDYSHNEPSCSVQAVIPQRD